VSFLKEELSPFVPATLEAGAGVPWEDPTQPRLLGFYRTLWEVLRHPGEFFGRLQRPDWAEPLAFGLITATLGLLASLYWHLLLAVAVQGLVGESGVVDKGTALTLILLVPGIALAHLGWGSLCLWGAVALLGVKTPFNPVWRLYCYAQGSMAAALIPFLGGPIAAVWMLFLIFRGVQRVFGVTAGRALGALFVSLFLQTLIFLIFVGSLTALVGLIWLRLFFG
jgi:hypothetical protein